MSDTTPNPIAKKTVVYTMPGVDAVTVRRDVEYHTADTGALAMDVYYPPGAAAGGAVPAVVLIAGYPDPGLRKMLGCPFKEMGSSVSWARLLAASGLVAITYTNHTPADVHLLLAHVRRRAGTLGIDESRLGVWASSGNVPLALSLLMRDAEAPLRCAVLMYGYTLDLDAAAAVANAATTFHFANPGAGRSMTDLRADIPMFVARAGRDETPGLNDTLDRFVTAALVHNLPLTLVNHADGPHAFDLLHDSDTSRNIVRQVLAFMRLHLLE